MVTTRTLSKAVVPRGALNWPNVSSNVEMCASAIVEGVADVNCNNGLCFVCISLLYLTHGTKVGQRSKLHGLRIFWALIAVHSTFFEYSNTAVENASIFRSYIAHPAMNWLDDYIDWMQPHGDPPCCRVFSNGSFCAASGPSFPPIIIFSSTIISLLLGCFLNASRHAEYFK